MFIIARHTISDPAKFWSDPDFYKKVPKPYVLHSTLGNPDGTEAVCLWEAPSTAELQKYLDGVAGTAATNDLMPVDENHSRGLPVQRAAA